MAERIRLGDMLVKAKLITEEQLNDALTSQKTSGRRLGEELVATGVLNELQVTQVLSNQLSLPWVDLRHVEFSRELLGLVPAELAHERCIIPIYVRRVRGGGDALFVAMDDPTHESTLDAVRKSSGLPVKAMVAPPTDIRDAIGVYYFGVSPSSRAVSLIPGAEDEAQDDAEDRIEESGEASSEARDGNEAEAPAAADEPSTPSQLPQLRGPRMVTLTLLDGTTIRLPEKKKQGDTGYGQSLTAKDFVQTLIAKAQGADVSDVLPDDGWETIVATLLSLMLKKRLIADWEFVDELERQRKRRARK